MQLISNADHTTGYETL